MHYDVFNGDTDGVIALLQLRLAEPKTSQLITELGHPPHFRLP